MSDLAFTYKANDYFLQALEGHDNIDTRRLNSSSNAVFLEDVPDLHQSLIVESSHVHFLHTVSVYREERPCYTVIL